MVAFLWFGEIDQRSESHVAGTFFTGLLVDVQHQPCSRQALGTQDRRCSRPVEPLAEIRKRRIFCRLTEASGGVDVKLGAEQPDDTVGGECNDAEHQVAERLEVAANAEMAATEFIFDASIGAFCGGPLVVCQVPGSGTLISRRLARSAAISALSAVSRRVLRSITGVPPTNAAALPAGLAVAP